MNEKPKLGTTDSALVSCVNLIAACTSTRTEDLISWLDLYYQVRRRWEIEQGNEEDPKLMRAEDLAPVLREMMRAYLKSSAREEAEGKAKKKGRDQTRSPSPSGAAPLPKRGQEDPSADPEPATETKAPGPWTLYKRKIFARLQQAREEGYTIAQIAEASGGVLSETKVIAAINATQLRQEEWRALETALSTVTMLQIPEGPEK